MPVYKFWSCEVLSMLINLNFYPSSYSSKAGGFMIQKYLELIVCLKNEVLVFKHVQLVLEMKYLGFNVSEW